jgi:hypothetical protein
LWWREEGKTLSTNREDAFIGPALNVRVALILNVIGRAVLPRCSPGDSLSVQSRDFLMELGDAGFPIERTLPFLPRPYPELRESVAEAMDRGMASPEIEKANSASRGLYLWMTQREECGGVAPPAELVQSLGSTIRGRLQPALLRSLRASHFTATSMIP